MILIATPLYSPQIGGPAKYAKNLKEQFESSGNTVEVVVFPKNIPTGIRHLVFFTKLKIKAFFTDGIVALDHFSVGLPAALISIFFDKKLIVRVGGDFLWEQYVARTGEELSIPEFYKEKPSLSLKEKIVFWASKFVFHHTDTVVFSTAWQRNIFLRPYGIAKEKTTIIQNYFPAEKTAQPRSSGESKKEFLWAGRMVVLKNLKKLIEAFNTFRQQAEDGWVLRLIGRGPEREALKKFVASNKLEQSVQIEHPVSNKELQEHIRKSWAVVLPSFSEVSPNLLIEAIYNCTPVIATQESGYTEKFGEYGIFIDTKDTQKIINALAKMAQKQARDRYVQNIQRVELPKHTWQNMAQEYLNLLI